MTQPDPDPAAKHNLAVFISGRGSNMQAIVEACQSGALPATVNFVLSDRTDAAGIAYAQSQGIETAIVDRRDFDSRQAHEKALLSAVNNGKPDWLLLAGFMRILSAEFIEACTCPILNIHPSRLPLYKGLNTHQRALDDNVKLHGASVHIVTPELDNGPVVAQSSVEITVDDDAERLAAKVLATEHRLYVFAIDSLLTHRVLYRDGKLTCGHGCDRLPLQLD